MSLNKELKELVHSTYEKATHIIQDVKNTFEHEKAEKYSNTVSNDEMTKNEKTQSYQSTYQVEEKKQKEIHNIVDVSPEYLAKNKNFENVSESLINASKLNKLESENKIAVSKLDM